MLNIKEHRSCFSISGLISWCVTAGWIIIFVLLWGILEVLCHCYEQSHIIYVVLKRLCRKWVVENIGIGHNPIEHSMDVHLASRGWSGAELTEERPVGYVYQ